VLHTGIPSVLISGISRIPPSVTAAAIPRTFSRIKRLPPNIPTSFRAFASITITAPAGIFSIIGVIWFLG